MDASFSPGIDVIERTGGPSPWPYREIENWEGE